MSLSLIICAVKSALFLFITLHVVKRFIQLFVRSNPSNVRMDGKVVIITGANTGIGYEAALDLAKRGARVVIACRNEKKATQAKEKIIHHSGNERVDFIRLDLSSLSSVKDFATKFEGSYDGLDVLINNAGTFGISQKPTKDGINEEMQVNYFGQFMLTLLLVPMLKKSRGRVVNVTSLLHYFAWLNLATLNGEHCDMLSYANSKLCMTMFTAELARRLEGTGVTVNCLHPGVIKTDIVNSDRNSVVKLLFDFSCWIFYRSPKDGAQTSVFLAVSDECKDVSGRYFVDCAVAWPRWEVHDRGLCSKLFDYSERMVDVRFN